MSISVRNITPDELIAFRKAEQYSFSFWDDEPIKPEYLQHINFDERFGAFVDGELAGTYSIFPFDQVVRGVWKPMGGVAGVTCLPEYRRKGVVGSLVLNSFKAMRERGQVVSALHPFRDTFYAKYNYVSTRGALGVTVDSVAFSHHLPILKQDEDQWCISRRPAVEMRPEYLSFLRELSLPSGFVTGGNLPDAVWQRRRKNWQVVSLMHGPQTEAMAIYKLEKFAEEGVLEVREMYWRSRHGRDRLFAFLALHREQTYKTRFKTAAGTDFQRWIIQPPTPYKLSLDHDTMMVRIMDVVGALQGLPAAVDGTLTFVYQDPFTPWNDGVYQLTAAQGQLQAAKTEQPAGLEMTVEGLTALAYGALPLDEVEHRGWVRGLTADTRPMLEAWFPEEVIYNPYFF